MLGDPSRSRFSPTATIVAAEITRVTPRATAIFSCCVRSSRLDDEAEKYASGEERGGVGQIVEQLLGVLHRGDDLVESTRNQQERFLLASCSASSRCRTPASRSTARKSQHRAVTPAGCFCDQPNPRSRERGFHLERSVVLRAAGEERRAAMVHEDGPTDVGQQARRGPARMKPKEYPSVAGSDVTTVVTAASTTDSQGVCEQPIAALTGQGMTLRSREGLSLRP